MSSDTVEQIKDRLGIDELVGSYLKMEKAGANFKALCPFHNEKTPSFIISPDRGSYYCFGCGAKGDIFSFVQNYENVDFLGALKILAERTGIEIKFTKDNKSSEIKNVLYKILETATHYYQKHLEISNEAKEYLKRRGLNDETIKLWRIGFVKDEWQSLYRLLKKKGVRESDIEKVGLIKKGDKGEYYDRFRGRIMFPFFDPSSRVVGFSGRIIKGDDKQAKYINSPETELFSKSKILYGYNFAKSSIRKNNFSILVEGQFDVIMAHQIGYSNTIATSGTALSDFQLEMIKRISEKMVIALDRDGAGLRASEKAWKMALAKGMDVKVAGMPEGCDPADLILEDPNKWKNSIKNSKHLIEFLIDVIKAEKLEKRKELMRVHKDIVPYTGMIDSSIDRAHFVKLISKEFDINEEALWQEVNQVSNKDEIKKEIIQNKKIISDEKSLEKRLIGILLWQEKKNEKTINPDELKDSLVKILGENYFNQWIEKINKNEDLIFEIEQFYETSHSIDRDLKEMLKRLEVSLLINKRELLQKKLIDAEFNNDEQKATEILREINDISKNIHNKT